MWEGETISEVGGEGKEDGEDGQCEGDGEGETGDAGEGIAGRSGSA